MKNVIFWADNRPEAIRKDHYKLIHFFDDNRYELYDLKKDASETMDISTENTKLTEELKNYFN